MSPVLTPVNEGGTHPSFDLSLFWLHCPDASVEKFTAIFRIDYGLNGYARIASYTIQVACTKAVMRVMIPVELVSCNVTCTFWVFTSSILLQRFAQGC